MKLLTKLTIFITGSKLLIVALFVILLPLLVSKVSFEYTNYYLGQQKKKVLAIIQKNGIDYYLQGDSAYGSYTMLKEEYISLLPLGSEQVKDTIETSQRIIESDTLNYRVLTHELHYDNGNYLLEIGKTTSTISQYNHLLQRFALYVLISLIILSIIFDLLYTNFLLRPLGKIINGKLVNRKFPFKESLTPVKTTTSDFKYLDNSLISLMEKIHEAFEKEREFTSNASHELLTPLSILQTNIENIMLDESLSESQQEKISGMMTTLNRLKKIIHSLLYISRIENEQFAKIDTVNLKEVIDSIGEELQQKLEIKELTFSNMLPEGLIFDLVNNDLLFQLFYNLINNAIRYNKHGGAVKITGVYKRDEGYNVAIEDTGIGIQEDELESIFSRFKKYGNIKGEGYGLGLSIVKTIASYHNYVIKVDTNLGIGSIFNVLIPDSEINRNANMWK
jgi:signal transduction histidine kinase